MPLLGSPNDFRRPARQWSCWMGARLDDGLAGQVPPGTGLGGHSPAARLQGLHVADHPGHSGELPLRSGLGRCLWEMSAAAMSTTMSREASTSPPKILPVADKATRLLRVKDGAATIFGGSSHRFHLRSIEFFSKIVRSTNQKPLPKNHP